jgi:hypothetical protein
VAFGYITTVTVTGITTATVTGIITATVTGITTATAIRNPSQLAAETPISIGRNLRPGRRAPIVASVAVNQETIRCGRVEPHGERAIAGGVSRSWTQDGVRADHFAAQGKPALPARIAIDLGPVVVDATGGIFGYSASGYGRASMSIMEYAFHSAEQRETSCPVRSSETGRHFA